MDKKNRHQEEFLREQARRGNGQFGNRLQSAPEVSIGDTPPQPLNPAGSGAFPAVQSQWVDEFETRRGSLVGVPEYEALTEMHDRTGSARLSIPVTVEDKHGHRDERFVAVERYGQDGFRAVVPGGLYGMDEKFYRCAAEAIDQAYADTGETPSAIRRSLAKVRQVKGMVRGGDNEPLTQPAPVHELGMWFLQLIREAKADFRR